MIDYFRLRQLAEERARAWWKGSELRMSQENLDMLVETIMQSIIDGAALTQVKPPVATMEIPQPGPIYTAPPNPAIVVRLEEDVHVDNGPIELDMSDVIPLEDDDISDAICKALSETITEPPQR